MVILVKIFVVVFDDVNSFWIYGIYQCLGVYEFIMDVVDEKNVLVYYGELFCVDCVVVYWYSGYMQGDGVVVVEQCF